MGIVRDATVSSFALDASNSACAGGKTSFYWAAFSGERAPRNVEPWIETGEVVMEQFAADCTPGDWYAWDIYFTDPFLAPPVVLVTGNDLRSERENPAVVGIAQYVTPFGFRLAARNSDCMAGRTGFYWVAIGWPQDCCAGERG